MNLAVVRTTLGRILALEGLLMLLPLVCSLVYRDALTVTLAYLAGGLITFSVGVLMTLKKPLNTKMYAQEGMVITALSWVLLSAFGALPLRFSGEFPSYIDALFEITSGFTTTGASVSNNVEALSKATLFWRSFTLFLGGMGVLVFALALQPKLQAESVHMMRAEIPGPTFSKISARLSTTARILYLIYVGMTVIMAIILMVLGMPFFDSLMHAFGTAGTGGFAIKNASIAHYASPAIEYALAIGMIMFGINFNLFYFVLAGRIKEVFKSEELRWYLGIIGAAVLLVMLNTRGFYAGVGKGLEEIFRDSFFTVSSMITTTGYTTIDHYRWPMFAQGIILVLMLVGSSAGSTGGGLKVSRIVMALKIGFNELRQVRQPRRVQQVRFEGKPVERRAMRSILSYLVIYAFVFIVSVLLISIDLDDFTGSFSAVLATLNNVGLSLADVAPTQNYQTLSVFSKMLLSFIMIAGRLEIWPVLILFSRETWRRT